MFEQETMNETNITPEIIAQHNLTPEEYGKIVNAQNNLCFFGPFCGTKPITTPLI